MTRPDLPVITDAHADSMLTRKFGREVANYFSGSPLNRLGFARGDNIFLSAAVQHASARFFLFRDLQPLTSKDRTRLAHVKSADVEPVIGNPYALSEDQLPAHFDSSRYIPQLVFLGISQAPDDAFVYKERYRGAPYFALDVTEPPAATTHDKAKLEMLCAVSTAAGNQFARGRIMELNAADASIYAEARQLLDWNRRNPFCAQCGQPTLSTSAGFKRACPPKDLATLKEKSPCSTRDTTSNISFPRTDPTAIMAVVNAAGTAVLLGRSKRYPPNFYSALAGFCEPGESIEEAVRREVYEEAGVQVGRVVIHSSQPWPYPASLMIGAVAQSVPGGETIDISHDPELEDAKWMPLDQVREMLKATNGLLLDEANVDGKMKIPGHTAIAHQLLLATVNGYMS